MNIVILSDTHMPTKGRTLPPTLMKALKTADRIIHAGDWSTVEVYHELTKYAPVTGMYGNVDDEEIRSIFPGKQIIDIEGFPKIGIVHGHGEGKTTEKRVIEAFSDADGKPDIIIFGHSHIPIMRYFKKQLLINPGSPTDKRSNPYYSFAVLTIGDTFEIRHVFFE